jgi:hypothetical protein
MARKLGRVGVASNVVFRYSESNGLGVVKCINIEDADAEGDTRYMVELIKNNGPNKSQKIAEFVGKTRDSGNHMTVPAAVIRNTEDIKPGRTVNVYLYEMVEEDSVELSDSSEVLARTEFIKRSSASFYNRAVSDYLEKENADKIKVRNTKNGKEVVAKTHTDYEQENDKNRFRFPPSAYDELDASPGDLAEIMPVEESDESVTELSQKEEIQEIHDMVSEMYDAYLSTKDD